MNDDQAKSFAESVAAILAAEGAHGIATSSLEGLGEISLRDATVVAAAAEGSRLRQAWMIHREMMPQGWKRATVDVVVARKSGGGEKWVVGTEIKWWRRDDGSNASGRRRDFVKDLLRSAALQKILEGPALVALLTTDISWNRTTRTSAGDADVTKRILASKETRWNLDKMKDAPAVRGAVAALRGKVPIVSAFTMRPLASCCIQLGAKPIVTARVWGVRKHQNTQILTDDELSEFLSKDSGEETEG